MEFVYSKIGVKLFSKVINLNPYPYDGMVRIAYEEYIFNKGTAEEFMLRLNMGPQAKAFLDSGKHVFVYAEGTKEFTMLQECGVKLTVYENGKNVFNLHRLIGLYHPQELFLTKLGMKDFKGKETDKESVDKKGGADAVATSADAVGTTADAAGGQHKECPICQSELADGEKIFNKSCSHIFHLDCFHGWVTAMHTTCPICRHDMMFKMEKVVELRQDMKIIRTH